MCSAKTRVHLSDAGVGVCNGCASRPEKHPGEVNACVDVCLTPGVGGERVGGFLDFLSSGSPVASKPIFATISKDSFSSINVCGDLQDLRFLFFARVCLKGNSEKDQKCVTEE